MEYINCSPYTVDVVQLSFCAELNAIYLHSRTLATYNRNSIIGIRIVAWIPICPVNYIPVQTRFY